MTGLIAIGSSQFLLGFQLAGVEQTVLTKKENVLSTIEKQEADIIILEEELVENISPEDRDELETQLHPVVIMLGKEGSSQQERIRRAIKNTLGVDLL